MGVIRLRAAILAEARAERISRQGWQLPITVAAKDTLLAADVVVNADNVFVAITAQAGRLYEVVYCRAVSRIWNQAQQELGSRIDTIGRDDVPGKRLPGRRTRVDCQWIGDLVDKIARSVLIGANTTRSRKARDAQIREIEVSR